jgi:GNAT superfamily N-acetyltransferase
MEFEAVERLSDAQVEELVELYQSEWWTKGRRREEVRCMLERGDLMLGFCDPATQKLVAFARVLTDSVYKAVVFDVIVTGSHRGKGVGEALMKAIVEHPELRSVKHIELYCLPELMPFYRRWGFSEELGELRLMRRTQ